MSKINEYRLDLEDKFYSNGGNSFNGSSMKSHFSYGFDACMDLRIGEKFAEWMVERVFRDHDGVYMIVHKSDVKKGYRNKFTLPELYDYYIENILEL